MYRLYILFTYTYGVMCASYQYGGSPLNSNYSSYQYTTISNLYNQYKTNYGSDLANFPEGSRYPNYNPGYSTLRPYTYNTNKLGNNYQSSNYPSNSYQANSYQSGYQPGMPTPRYGEVYGTGAGHTSYEMPFMTNRGYCVNRSPQIGIYVDSLKGMWYGVEFIQHLAGDSRVDYARTCIVIHISEPMDRPSTEHQAYHVQHINAKLRQSYRYLRLLWDEAGETIEYSLYFSNASAGYWQTFETQTGSLTSRPSYQQFSGTVQVLKAVDDHLVLSFCQEASNSAPAQLYSILFSREPGVLVRWEIDAVHAMLQNKKLSIASRRMVCGNSADKPIYSIIFSIFTCALAYAISS
ncbi:uncharacterized protein [Epargyreus clarus]|uniref:uncharacterized protein isoform X1 n=1 Tax=Epargyreus clarus TaxID=520877 RepID=UPI003C2D9AD2